MQVETVTAIGFGLLGAVRATLATADEALLCVAFAHERGVRLIARELEAARLRGARTRLLVTNVFDRGGNTDAALAVARSLGVDVRIHNHAGGTYHPKLYLGSAGASARAVVGSANLTAGLACNVEVGVELAGVRTDRPIGRAWEVGEALWADARSEAWEVKAAEAGGEEIAPALLAALLKLQRTSPVIETLGPNPRANRLAEVTPTEVLVETDRTRQQRTGPQAVPAWMLNLAWDYLTSRGEVTNTTLLNELRVHRSSFVCAALARLPGVEVASVRPITLRWRGAR
jgi:hypothetical protein